MSLLFLLARLGQDTRTILSMPFCLFWSRCGKGKLEDGDGINLNDIEKVLPAWQVGAWGRVSPHPFFPQVLILHLGRASALLLASRSNKP